SAAEKAGLQKEDIIIAANGQEAKTIDALNTIKNTLKPGDQLTLTIIRENREQKIDLVLQEELPDSYKPANYNRQADQQVEL
ncbi:MAG: PDZ domain-containing protein, partial [Eubacteriales bacterium]|nr:PDZ domain-containing protein [Eubacteriales bacterium]